MSIRDSLRAFAGGVALALVLTTANALAAAQLTESGSTLLYPMMQVWIAHYKSVDADVTIDAEATGSGEGIHAATVGTAQIGGSDAYLNDTQRSSGTLVNIPLAVSAQEVDYNVKELHDQPPLHLSGPVLAGIFAGTIVNWDDPKIVALNAGRTLPHRAIHPIHRTEGSGDTFMFTQYLSFSTPAWETTTHYGTLVHWPANARALEAIGNAGMIDTAARTADSIAYVGISYADRARAAGLVPAALQNRSGAFILPTDAATKATAEASAVHVTDDGRLSMIDTPGASAYPLVNFEYAVVKVTHATPGRAAAIRDFLNWIIAPTKGNDAALLAQVHFAPLPDRVRAIAEKQIAAITGP